MKNLIKNTIIAQAIELGFDFEQFPENYTLNEVNDELTEFFNDNLDKLPRIEDECEVTVSNHSQHVRYADYWADGQIIDFRNYYHLDPSAKVFHSNFLFFDKNDGLMKEMNLYYTVGETELNVPDGYYYCHTDKKHKKINTLE